MLVLTLLLAFAAAAPVVQLGYTQYEGVINDTLGLTTYYGIQYAAPPNGTLRWQPPVPIENSTLGQSYNAQTLNASTPGPRCVQSAPSWAAVLNEIPLGFLPTLFQVDSEDCLRLDVIVPNSPISTSLPVIVQIHGGGYTLGSSQTSEGSFFTSYANGSVIYVQIQYRLGFYGFLSGQVVKSNGVPNAGLLDQRAALEWVQRNIASFGGDPDKVTIWGGSAGGGSVTAQLQLYGGESNPPFRAAIAEYPWWQRFHSDVVLEAQYKELLQASNCTDLTCLRSLSASALVQANQAVYTLGYEAGNYGYGDFYAGPSVDGNIIQELPTSAFQSGRYSRVPLLTDRDGFEGALFSNFTITQESQVQPDLATMWQTISPSFFTRLFQLYPLSDFTASYFNNSFFARFSQIVSSTSNNSPYWQRQTIYGDYVIACPTYYIASAFVDAGQPVWKLVFAAGTELHGATVPFLVASNAATPNATLAAIMKSYFLAFVVNLDPNSDVGNGTVGVERPQWPAYLADGQAGGFTVLSINQTSIGVEDDPDAGDRCDFFRGQSFIVRN